MTDTIGPERRSRNMSRIRSRNTRPEMAVRRLLHRMGHRYRLHRKDLPGTPDIAFGPRRKVIFVHGCFWHGHACRRGIRVPKSNIEYWRAKIARNVKRHAGQLEELTAAGWTCLTLWECELADADALERRLNAFLNETVGT